MTPVEQAVQAWLALEHEAVWLYPVVGARVDGLRKRAGTSYRAHRDTRDALLAAVRSLGLEPVVAALGYAAGPLTTRAQASAAAQSLESRISAATLTLAGEAEGDLRALAITHLRRSALAELTWGAEPKAFPGLP
ncbi:DUF4439 domain-containing protein [Aeromicrobium fastidiosum]|uniref:DUF4439 domain-containing protein n=1 Tax=Aeromicrobium fastidiosum TaxID=52699 RepID=A0A641ALF3_9ACTN|nr:DUF4439 domain-containing protein [Aeromicrobium fastidiosum]KAA1376510.1 DUF4439 domain-containing protein [Aeromicrobium fastidiosum]MBP2391573.1 hypothetical protein [Aeromicrobium fastidiosum]